MVLHNRLWFYIMDYVKSIISEIIPGLWTLWTNYEHYEVPEPLMIGARQTEPPAPEKGLVHVFSLQQATSTGRISAPRPAEGLTCGGVAL